ncbi:Piwi domain-domain-containing protein [Leucosporidium creatinivorum]|uniref:Piwi domain-domain-containing protein n=1 Tax=Leucosporidium creatinivorum TaxID=106004 RepID=A0A1Y2E9K8_9BASI|nr:Piwi domain-domain-containing protein [Leucosporidium creatinivorum]
MNIFEGVAVCFDGRAMAYSPRPLRAEDGNWDINLPEDDGTKNPKGRMFHVQIKFTRTIDIGRLGVFVRGEGAAGGNFPDASEVQSATQALNVLIQHGPSSLYPNRAASFFLPPENRQAASLLKGLEMWRGFYTSLRPGPNKIFVNLDIASQPMYQSGNLADVVLDFLRAASRGITLTDLAASKIPPRGYIELDRFLRGVKVQLKVKDKDGHEPVRKIKQFEKTSAAAATFKLEDGSSQTVESYFKLQYGVTLKRPDFPCVRVSKVALWPLELCDVEAGQKWTEKLDPDQTAAAIKLTTVGPKERVKMLNYGLTRIQPKESGASAALAQWGVTIKKDPIVVQARELKPPTVTYQRSLQPREGVWDMRGGHQFYSPAKIDRWLILVFDSDRFFRLEEAQASVMGLVAACTQVGLSIKDQRPPIHYVPRNSDINAYILSKGSELVRSAGGPPQMLICFLPRKPCDEYATIKRLGDVDKGVATQCLFINKAKRGNPQYYGNIALKMNVKMRGINSILDPASLGPIAEKPTMLFGADVSHPSPGSLAPSIAALVGSMDSKASLYGTSVRVQSSRVEVIAHLDDMTATLIKQFQDKLKVKPQRLIFFRDGISEGQFPQVLATEVAAIRLACKKLGADYSPDLTYIVCGKRHHMSFFPKNDVDAARKNGNCKAGTTIDTDVTSAYSFDWYTQSHASLLGTGRSAHYTVLVDDSKFSADTLQQLVFNLCFTYARCTRSVSYATPAYYADRVATRAQLLWKRDDDDSSTVVSSHSGASEEKIRVQQLAEWSGRLKDIHVNHSESLYFL